MRKYIIIGLLLTGCSNSVPTYQPTLNYDSLENDNSFKWFMLKQTEKAIVNINIHNKMQTNDCNKIGKCLGKATYFKFDTDSLTIGKCVLASTDKEVSCND